MRNYRPSVDGVDIFARGYQYELSNAAESHNVPQPVQSIGYADAIGERANPNVAAKLIYG